jgi:hypothetical protein
LKAGTPQTTGTYATYSEYGGSGYGVTSSTTNSFTYNAAGATGGARSGAWASGVAHQGNGQKFRVRFTLAKNSGTLNNLRLAFRYPGAGWDTDPGSLVTVTTPSASATYEAIVPVDAAGAPRTTGIVFEFGDGTFNISVSNITISPAGTLFAMDDGDRTPVNGPVRDISGNGHDLRINFETGIRVTHPTPLPMSKLGLSGLTGFTLDTTNEAERITALLRSEVAWYVTWDYSNGVPEFHLPGNFMVNGDSTFDGVVTAGQLESLGGISAVEGVSTSQDGFFAMLTSSPDRPAMVLGTPSSKYLEVGINYMGYVDPYGLPDGQAGMASQTNPITIKSTGNTTITASGQSFTFTNAGRLQIPGKATIGSIGNGTTATPSVFPPPFSVRIQQGHKRTPSQSHPPMRLPRT